MTPSCFEMCAVILSIASNLMQNLMVSQITAISDYLFNNLFRLSKYKTSTLHITDPLNDESSVTNQLPLRKEINAESISMSCTNPSFVDTIPYDIRPKPKTYDLIFSHGIFCWSNLHHLAPCFPGPNQEKGIFLIFPWVPIHKKMPSFRNRNPPYK